MSENKSEPPGDSSEPKNNVASHEVHDRTHSPSIWVRIREATGTVYGDIGTSVLYTIMEITREAIHLKNHHLPEEEISALVQQGGADLLSRNDLLGALSLIIWALIFLTVKYDLLVMRADDR